MKRLTHLALGILLAASAVGCSRDNRAKTDETPSGGAAVGTSGGSADRDFILDQAEDGRAEIELSKMAAERATNPQVKDFARMMVRDHTKAVADLREAAAAANVQLSTTNEAERHHLNMQEALGKLTGRAFDRKYLSTMVGEHEEAVNEIEENRQREHAGPPVGQSDAADRAAASRSGEATARVAGEDHEVVRAKDRRA